MKYREYHDAFSYVQWSREQENVSLNNEIMKKREYHNVLSYVQWNRKKILNKEIMN